MQELIESKELSDEKPVSQSKITWRELRKISRNLDLQIFEKLVEDSFYPKHMHVVERMSSRKQVLNFKVADKTFYLTHTVTVSFNENFDEYSIYVQVLTNEEDTDDSSLYSFGYTYRKGLVLYSAKYVDMLMPELELLLKVKPYLNEISAVFEA